jgi:hypothetical protein
MSSDPESTYDAQQHGDQPGPERVPSGVAGRNREPRSFHRYLVELSGLRGSTLRILEAVAATICVGLVYFAFHWVTDDHPPIVEVSAAKSAAPMAYDRYWDEHVAGDDIQHASAWFEDLPDPGNDGLPALGWPLTLTYAAEHCGNSDCSILLRLEYLPPEETYEPTSNCDLLNSTSEQLLTIEVGSTNGPTTEVFWIPIPQLYGAYRLEYETSPADDQRAPESPYPTIELARSGTPAYMPDDTEAPPGFVITGKGENSFQEIVDTFPGRDESGEQLALLGWVDNWYRIFEPSPASPYFDTIDEMEVSVHQFHCSEGADKAVELISDARATLLDMEIVDPPLADVTNIALAGAYVDSDRLPEGSPPKNISDYSILFARDNFVFRVSAYSWDDDPRSSAIDMANAILEIEDPAVVAS